MGHKANNAEILKFKVKYTKNIYIEFNKFNTQILLMKNHLTFYFVILLIFSICLYKAYIVATIISALIFVIYTVIFLTLPYTYVNRMIKKDSNQLDKKVEFSFRDENLLVNSEELQYEDIIKAYETKKVFYLYISESQAFIIPKKAIAGNISVLRQILKLNGIKYMKIV